MSKNSKWKFEKTKVKVVFRLQFHATHIPQSGWDKLFISLIPTDSGKATAKTTKANARNGSCKWADPIYETTRLLQDTKSKQYDEKLYKLVVSMGSSRASVLGEAIINLAEYADAVKPSIVGLPLHGCNFGTTLHVTVQLLTSKTGFREFEQQRELRDKGIQSGDKNDGSNPGKETYLQDMADDRTDKVHTRLRYPSDIRELSSVEEDTGNEEYTESSPGFEGSSKSSESLYTDKNDTSINSENDSFKNNKASLDTNGSIDHPVNGDLDSAISSVFELKLEVTSLQSQAKDLGIETEKFSSVLASEISSSKKLVNEVSELKSECFRCKEEIERLKDVKSISLKRNDFVSDTGLEIEVCEPEIMLQHLTSSRPVVSQVNDTIIEAMKKDIFDLVKELDEAKVEREGLVRKMGQMECYYEALVQELEETQKQLMGELKNIKNEHSSCLYELSTAKVGMEDMSHQIVRLNEEMCGLDGLNKELERRASISDTALRRARLNYSIAVEKLQKDLELLSSQVVSMFETNETLIKQAFSEPPKPVYATRNSEDFDVIKLLHSPSQNASVRKEKGREIFLEDLKQTLCVQEEIYHKVEEELTDMHSVNLHLDIFSKALIESLSESCSVVRHLRAREEELENRFRVSDESKNVLMVRLQGAMDEVNNLREYSARCNAHYNDVAMQNQILESKLESILNENSLLLKEIKDHEAEMAVQCRNYQSQYVTCLAEKSKLSDLLSQETLLSSKRECEISTLNEELEILKTKTFGLCSSKENLEETVNFVQEKLLTLLRSCDEESTGHSSSVHSYILESKSMDWEDALSLLEDKILQLMNKNKKLENENLSTDIFLSAFRSEFLDLQKKFKSNVNDIVIKFDASNVIVEDFGVKLDSVSNKLVQTSESGERHVQKHRELLDHLVILETEMQMLLVREISCFDAVSTELESSKLTIGGLLQEKQELVKTLKTLQVELEIERDIKMEQNKSRELSFRNFELENSRVKDLLLERDVLVEKLRIESCSVSDLEAQLTDALEYAVNVDVKGSIFTCLYQTRIKELEQKLLCSDGTFRNLQRRYNEKESEYMSEISKLEKFVESTRSELEQSFARNGVLLESNETFVIKLSEYKKKFEALEVRNAEETDLHTIKEKKWKKDVEFAEEEIIGLEIMLLGLKCKTKEWNSSRRLLEEIEKELFESRAQCIELENSKADLERKNDDIVMEFNKHKERTKTLKNSLVNAEEEIIDLNFSKHILEITMIEITKLLEESEKELMTWRFRCTDISSSKSILERENNVIRIELHECKKKLEDFESNNCLEIAEKEIIESTFLCELLQSAMKDLHVKLQQKLDSSMLMENEQRTSLRMNYMELEEEITITTLSKEQSEITILLLKEKLHELRSKYTGLSRKLSEQTLKTVEYKNLSIHLKELQEKTVIDSQIAREKKDTMQESLRVAFIKEQYETKLQELKLQVSMSKKHGEEMLLKLQDAVDEIENRKRSEALNLKRNEELAFKVLGLEDELKSVISDNRERIRAHDRMKAEFECAALSLECCKEEKELLEISLRECEDKKSTILAELSLTKKKLEDQVHCPLNESTDSIHKNDVSDIVIEDRAIQESKRTEINGFAELEAIEGHLQQHTNGTHLSSQFRSQDLKSSIMHLYDELERVKKENFVIPEDDTFGLELVQKDIIRLDKANEELGSMFPLDDEVCNTGNALESFLDLEVELAQTLKAKFKSKTDIQRQQCEEETILKSFRDINNLIKEMLQLKVKHVAMEGALRDMHDRYSRLSLEFAEVEGDRQKLKMTLKNVRASRKLMHLNRSSSPVNAEVSS